jgi:hypothetical protein
MRCKMINICCTGHIISTSKIFLAGYLPAVDELNELAGAEALAQRFVPTRTSRDGSDVFLLLEGSRINVRKTEAIL